MKIVNKGIKVRIYPNREQKEQFSRNFGSVRFVYNNILERLNKVIDLMEYQMKVQDRIIKEYEDGD